MNNLQDNNELKANDNNLPLINTENAAIAYAAAGLSVLPLELPEKKPSGIASWIPLQQTIASSEEIRRWYMRPNIQVGIICGKISNGLELLDFDEKYNIENMSLFLRFSSIVESLSPGLIDKLVLEKSISNGFHLVYKSNVIERNQKLAMRLPTLEEIESPKTAGIKAGPKTLIETRGEGGYFMCAPSIGYKIIHGSFENIPIITKEERDILLNTARSFNEVLKEEDIINAPINLDGFDKRPGDDFNIRGDIKPVLRKNGWKSVGKNDRGEYWRRPGKTIGVSALLISGKKDEIPLFAVYSTNAHPLEANKYHTPFSIFTQLGHGGDYQKAAAALASEGFGSTTISKAEEHLSNRYEFRLNIITSKTEYRKIGSTQYEEITDVHLNSLYRQLQRYHIKIGLDVLASLLRSDFVPIYDPFLEYYSSLPKWDEKTDYIENLSETVTLRYPEGSDATKQNEHKKQFVQHLKKWMVNAVGCAINPEITNHNALILVGPQGRYKTTWLNRFVPKILDRYKFVGTINPDNKDTLIHLSECFLINLDELETLKKGELGSLKSIMTLQHIHVRRPYGRIAENLIRRASFVGSINRREFLNDETGTRRFLTYEIESIDIDSPIDMNKVHAQAYYLYKNNFQYWFNTNEIDTVNTSNEQFTVRATEDELVEKMVRPATNEEINTGTCKWKSGTEIALYANFIFKFPVNKNSARDFGTALKRAGFESKRVKRGMQYAIIELPELEYYTKTLATSNQAPPTTVPVPEELGAGGRK
ncbi:MAG: VapE domain-containing protein [Bacteroidota bacterium]